MKWRLLTVGGSDEPVVKSVCGGNADKVVFICSRSTDNQIGSDSQILGEGLVCGSKEYGLRLNIPNQCGLNAERYEILLLDNPDDLNDCYEKISECITGIRDRDKSYRMTCDYTGGTKTMSAALTLCAVNHRDVQLSIIAGPRRDLIRVQSGLGNIAKTRRNAIDFRIVCTEVDQLLVTYQFDAAAKVLSEYSSDSNTAPDAKAVEYLGICQGFNAWDKFDLKNAQDWLKYCEYIPAINDYLGALNLLTRAGADAWKSDAGYLLVEDLMLNAERCASRGRYDDAIARHYRAVELFAQTFLYTQWNIDTASILPEQLPSDKPYWRNRMGNRGELQIALQDAWSLASDLSPAILKDFYSTNRGLLKDACTRRNTSLFAHGTTPVSKDDYAQDVSNGMSRFVELTFGVLKDRGIYSPPVKMKQFPDNITNDI